MIETSLEVPRPYSLQKQTDSYGLFHIKTYLICKVNQLTSLHMTMNIAGKSLK